MYRRFAFRKTGNERKKMIFGGSIPVESTQATGFQSPAIQLTAPANYTTVDPDFTSLSYTINSVPALNPPVTDALSLDTSNRA
jgi:hypothetical protein